MTQYVEGFIALPPDSLEPNSKNVRQFVYTIYQQDGVQRSVCVEGTVLVDPTTGNPITAMSYSQGQEVISLLKEIRDILKNKTEED